MRVVVSLWLLHEPMDQIQRQDVPPLDFCRLEFEPGRCIRVFRDVIGAVSERYRLLELLA